MRFIGYPLIYYQCAMITQNLKLNGFQNDLFPPMIFSHLLITNHFDDPKWVLKKEKKDSFKFGVQEPEKVMFIIVDERYENVSEVLYWCGNESLNFYKTYKFVQSFKFKVDTNCEDRLIDLFLTSVSTEKCFKDLKEENQEVILKWLKSAEERCSAAAEFVFGMLYGNGYILEKNQEKACEYYLRSANKGYKFAQYKLGLRYLKGSGVEKNIEKGLELIQKAGDQDYLMALHKLGVIYEEGLGEGEIKRDPQKAFSYYMDAAMRGCDSAQFRLGKYFEKGFEISGVLEKDFKKSYSWYIQSASNCKPEILYNIGLYYECGTDVFKQNEILAFKYYEHAAKLGYEKAQYKLGECYQKGIGIEKDLSEAESWYMKAYDQGNKEAEIALESLKDTCISQ